MSFNLPSRKHATIWGGILLVVVLLFLFRIPIMRGMGNFLIKTDPYEKVGTVFVLSGGPFDRGREAARLYHQGLFDTIVCTGETVPQDIKAIGLKYGEGKLSKLMMERNDVPADKIVLIEEGTSTREESGIIINYCKARGITKVAVISSLFHTRRVGSIIKDKFENEGIEVLVWGAKSEAFDEQAWWQNEYGLINLNNEYIKTVYYWIKY